MVIYMLEIIGVRFKNAGKIYYFDPAGEEYKKGDSVIVKTAQNIEMGEVSFENRLVEEDNVVQPLRPVLRRATDDDHAKVAENEKKHQDALALCQKLINEHGIEMKLIDVEYTFDGSKILFYFTAEGRVDFRELVKSLASAFKARIELRQIGVRDEAKLLGGLGVCGQELCCRRFLGDFEPVSIKMAKEQGLSLNPTKISGTCGRLMCCLKYEQDSYEYLLKTVPRADSVVKTPDGKGVVVDSNLLTGNLKVKLTRDETSTYAVYNANQVAVIRDGKIPQPDKEEAEPKKFKKRPDKRPGK